MKFGLSYNTGLAGTDPANLKAIARHADDRGFDSFYLPEHVTLYPVDETGTPAGVYSSRSAEIMFRFVPLPAGRSCRTPKHCRWRRQVTCRRRSSTPDADTKLISTNAQSDVE